VLPSEIILRLLVALMLGITMGFERQWHNHYAGLRTNTLIAIGSAGMMIFAEILPHTDPSGLARIAGQIVTGVGFLCAGVIMHEGINVKGLNTSATMWCSAGVGMCVGAGLFMPATLIAIFVLLANLMLRPLVYYINSRTPVSDELEAHYTLTASCAAGDAGRIRAAFLTHLGKDTVFLKNLETQYKAGTAQINAELLLNQRMDKQVEAITAKIGHEAGVSAIKWHVI
jgi:putative Mg2+ transporter-C (MgtC) family protein